MVNKKNYETAYSQARDLYENSDMSINTIADYSIQLLGIEMPLSTLRAKSVQEHWQKKSTDVNDITAINQVESIINDYLSEEKRGALSIKEISELVISMDRLQRMKSRYKTVGAIKLSGGPSTSTGRTTLLGDG